MYTKLESSLVHRDTPKINGSSGAFIGLVVALGVIILVSCSAVYYLLRYYEPSDAERATRRQRRYRQRSGNPITNWFSNLFSERKEKAPPSKGWVQASSGDEWDTDDSLEGGRRELSQVTQDSPFRPPISILHSSDSSSSVRFELQESPRKTARTMSPIPGTGDDDDKNGRTFSYESAASSTRTFSGGTKFIEAL